MDDQSLRNVLAILRMIQIDGSDHDGASVSAIQFIRYLATGVRPRNRVNRNRLDREDDGVSLARVAAYLLDQFSEARQVIDSSQLVEEAKVGVRSALTALNNAFQIGALRNSLGPLANSAPGYISNFVILLSAAGLPVNETVPAEAKDLAAEIDEVAARFSDKAIDPVVREIAAKHLATLATLLRHIPVFGVEAALQSYFELLMKLRRADSKSTPESKSRLDSLMASVKSWGDKLQTLDGMINTGANLLDRAGKAAPLLQYLPTL